MQKIHLRNGVVSAKPAALNQVKPMLMRMGSSFFPKRGNAIQVEDELRELARVNPRDFTEGSRCYLGV